MSEKTEESAAHGEVNETSEGKAVFNLEEFLEMKFPDSGSIVDRKIIIPGGLTVFGAQPKVGKSYIQMQLALARAWHEPWLGFATTPGRTLYINAEIVPVEFQHRFKQMIGGRTRGTLDTVFVSNCLGRNTSLNNAEGKSFVNGLIQDTAPDLVILDPMTHFMDGNESKPEDIRPFLDALGDLRARHNLAISLVHHLRKPLRQGPRSAPDANDLSGSSLLYREVDATIVADGKPGTDQAVLRFSLRHALAPEPLVIRRGTDLWWQPTGAAFVPPILERALRLLLSGPLKYTDWVAAIMNNESAGNSTARRRVQEARAAKLAVDNGTGYELSMDARKALGPPVQPGALPIAA